MRNLFEDKRQSMQELLVTFNRIIAKNDTSTRESDLLLGLQMAQKKSIETGLDKNIGFDVTIGLNVLAATVAMSAMFNTIDFTEKDIDLFIQGLNVIMKERFKEDMKNLNRLKNV